MALLIRAATSTDRDALVQIGLAAWISGIAPLLEDLHPEELNEIEKLFDDFITAHFFPNGHKTSENPEGCSSYLFCADLGGQVVGFYALQTSLGKEGYLSDLWVAPQWHGQGIATPLIQDALDKCRENHQTGLALKVLAENKRALAFYEKNGFSETRSGTAFDPMLKRDLPRLEMLCRF
jgi:ribosomal protein S18 acetylase RimI-like enzyme